MVANTGRVSSWLSTISRILACCGASIWAAVVMLQYPPVRPSGSGRGNTRLTWLWPLTQRMTFG